MNIYAQNCEHGEGVEDYAHMTITRTVYGREVKIPLTLDEIKRAYDVQKEMEGK